MGDAATTIFLASNEGDIRACYPLMLQLRPHIQEQEFVEQVQRQFEVGYQLAMCVVGEAGQTSAVRAVAGFRLAENLAWGKHLYVDDLVCDELHRSSGYGGQLFDWLLAYAGERQCQQLHLDSGVQRFAAHRFYLNKKMKISSHHFAIEL